MASNILRFRINDRNELREGYAEVLSDERLRASVLNHSYVMQIGNEIYALFKISVRPDSTRVISYRKTS